MKGPSNSNLHNYAFPGLICCLILFGIFTAQGQQPFPVPADSMTGPIAADLARVGILNDISANTFVHFAEAKYVPKEQLTSIRFTIRGSKKYEHFIPAFRVNSQAVLRFTVTNSSDSANSAYFCPGFYYDSIKLFKLAGIGGSATSTAVAMPRIMPDDADSLGYRRITVQAHETATFYVVLNFIRSATNSLNPSLTRENYITQGIILNHRNRTNINIITNLFAGIMLMMIVYALSQYLQTGKLEFLYYACYSICISSLLFLKSIHHNATTPFNFFFEGYLDNIIFSVGHVFYIIFHRNFLETKKNYPDLDRFLYWGSIVILGLTFLFSLSFFYFSDFRVSNYVEAATKVILLIVLLVFIIKGLGYRNQLVNYIVAGNISFFLLSIISLFIVTTDFKLMRGASVLNLALFYYEVGITIEVIFFLFALTYKNKMELIASIQKEEKLKLETERKELEKQVAVLAAKQDERNRISVDMHDELGSGVTAIRLMSEIVKSKMKEKTLPEIEKISHSANELLNKMNTIIWTMTSSNDTVENLVAYIRSFAVEFFENTTIDCYFSMPSSIPNLDISGEKRRNIFLSVKEALNNVLKHSQGTVVKVNVQVDDRLTIEIKDDGVGIDMEKLRKFGNGLNNMKKRMNSIDGEFLIINENGTRTRFSVGLGYPVGM